MVYVFWHNWTHLEILHHDPETISSSSAFLLLMLYFLPNRGKTNFFENCHYDDEVEYLNRSMAKSSESTDGKL